MSDIFSEVDEEVRKDKSVELWNRYGKYVIAGSVLIVAATASVVGWKNYQLSVAQTQGAQFQKAAALVGEQKFDDAAAAFSLLAKDGGAGYQALASLRQASALAQAGKGDEAVQVYDALAVNPDVDPEFSAIAKVMAGYYLLNKGSTEEVRKRVADMEGANHIWSATARELLALSDLKDGKIEDARTKLKALQEDASAPSGVKQRAGDLLTALKNK